ncbi:uncharacterized protein LOC122938912 [Bufo gargarizans]|uniref:uncharacterized protein LOC122938912 n=1 Tax=Bufo gargarizans TaxID=30331 RepID=UPI001CF4347D|nr:uncharacterized protein LOC122938912 [Bufo gargarizans]
MASSQSKELVEIRSFGTPLGYFKEKEFLSVEDIYHSLPERSINKAGVTMRSNILQTRSDAFLHLPVEFSISGLQHCTTMDSTRKILESQSFIGREHEREELKDLFFWSVNVPSTDIEKAQEEAYTHVQEHIPPQEAKKYKEEITKQFANSPAFNQASRYGNFRFSYQFSDLLSLYEAQFCEGKKPQLSILGTDVYKQEIAHYVVVHCPDSTRFKDHPRVPRLQTRCEPLPNVFLVDDTLYWRPESTSNALKVRTKDGHITACNQPEPCKSFENSGHCFHYDRCAWNHLVIAFHIPQGDALKIPVENLIKHLSACSALDPFMKENSRMKRGEAEKQFKDFQQQYLGRSQELRPKVNYSHGDQFGKHSDRTPHTETNIHLEGKKRRREAESNEKLHDCRAPTMENVENTTSKINNSTLQSEQFFQSMLDCQKQLITSIENVGKNLSEGFHSLCQELRNVTGAITSFQMDISRREHRPPSSIETKVGRKTFTSSPSSSLRSDDLTTTSRVVVDGPEVYSSQVYGEQKSLLNEDSLETQMDGGKPEEGEEVREQPSAHVRVKQERNGGSVTGKHAAERGDPHELEESSEQYGPPLKKKNVDFGLPE